MKHYQDTFADPADRLSDAVVTAWSDGGQGYALNPRFDLRNHSPTGFAWGYSGSGPAQLALALCADVLGDDARAQEVYQDFKRLVVATWDKDSPWKISAAEILRVVSACR